MKTALAMIVGIWLALVVAMVWLALTGRPGLAGIALTGALMVAATLWLAGTRRAPRYLR